MTWYLVHLKFNKKLSLYFHLSIVTWFLIGFHGNHSYINDVASGRHPGYLSIQILFKLEIKHIKMTRKQYLAIEIYKIVRIYCKIVSIYSIFSKILHFHSQLTDWVTYYDDVISCNVTWLESKDVLTNKQQLYQSSFDNWSSSKNLKPKKSRGVNLTPPLEVSRVNPR